MLGTGNASKQSCCSNVTQSKHGKQRTVSPFSRLTLLMQAAFRKWLTGSKLKNCWLSGTSTVHGSPLKFVQLEYLSSRRFNLDTSLTSDQCRVSETYLGYRVEYDLIVKKEGEVDRVQSSVFSVTMRPALPTGISKVVASRHQTRRMLTSSNS
jgi:hypothetical protein